MKFVENIKRDEYEEFVENHPNGHFMQSYDFGEIRKGKHFIPHYVGMKENGKLVCSALLLEKSLKFGYCYFYSPRGYTIDFENQSLLAEFTSCLKNYARKKKAIFIKIDPGLKYQTLNQEGEVIDGEEHRELVSYLQTLGYHHLGFNKGFEHEQPRFTFRIDLNKTWEEVYQTIHPTTRKILNKGNQYELDVYKGSSHDINDFYITMIETAKREALNQSPIQYYKDFYEVFHKSGHSDLYIVKANLKKVCEVFEKKIQMVKEEIQNYQSDSRMNASKVKNKVNDLEKQLNKLEKDYEEVKKVKEKEIPLSSIITVKYGDKVWTVHGGNHSILMNLNANYLCYYTIMKDAFDEGYKCMDCFGTCGEANPDKTNPIYGIHNFKKRLGGEYTEFIGEFDYVVYPFLYKAFHFLVPIYHKIKR